MICIDGIVFKLQRQGGISVYFRELLDRFPALSIPTKLLLIDEKQYGVGSGQIDVLSRPGRIGERYRNCPVDDGSLLFHSSYYRLPARSNVSVVTTVHDFTYELLNTGPRQWVHSWQKFRAIKASDAVICISENTKRDLQKFLPKFPVDRLFVVPNGVSHLFRPLEGIARPERPYALFVGRRDSYKNFHEAVRAVALVKEVDLYLVGGGRPSTAELTFLETRLPGRFKHFGNVSTEELNLLYNRALCLLFPSQYEGFGIPILEAMRAGCPVIAVNKSSIPEVAGDAGCLVEGADVDLLVGALGMMGDAKRRSDFRSRGFERAAQFSWQRTFIETVRIYEHLLGREVLPPIGIGRSA